MAELSHRLASQFFTCSLAMNWLPRLIQPHNLALKLDEPLVFRKSACYILFGSEVVMPLDWPGVFGAETGSGLASTVVL